MRRLAATACGLGLTVYAVACMSRDPYVRIARELSKPFDSAAPRTVAVMTFKELDGRAAGEGAVVAERVTTQLVRHGRIRLVERTMLDRVMAEHHLDLSGAIEPGSVRKLGELVGADAIVTGTVGAAGNSGLEINARAVEVGSGRIVVAARVLAPRLGTLAGLPQARTMTASKDPGSTESSRPTERLPMPVASAAKPTAGVLPVAGVIRERLYVSGGSVPSGGASAALEEYDPKLRSWTVRASAGIPRSNAAAAVIGAKLFVVGGCRDADCRVGVTDSLEIFDAATGSWETGPDMPTARGAAAAAAVDGSLYVFGGHPACPPCAPQVDVVERFDSRTRRWSRRAPMPTPRDGLAAVALNGRIYVIGGLNRDRGADTGAVEIYDPAKDEWKIGASMPTARHYLAMVAHEGRIFALGGDSGGVLVDCVEVYDPAANKWEVRKPMPWARNAMAAVAVGKLVFMVGGYLSAPFNRVVTGRLDAFDPATASWEVVYPTPRP